MRSSNEPSAYSADQEVTKPPMQRSPEGVQSRVISPDKVTEAVNAACAEINDTEAPFASTAARRILERNRVVISKGVNRRADLSLSRLDRQDDALAPAE